MGLEPIESVLEKASTTGMLVLTNQDIEEVPSFEGKFLEWDEQQFYKYLMGRWCCACYCQGI